MQRREKSHEWLQKLARESWQLELIISGFSIFLLIQGLTGLQDRFQFFFNRVQILDYALLQDFTSYLWFLLIGAKGLLYSLILHLFLRGLWIAAVGLRTFNKRTDLASQGYTPLFQKTLKRNTLDLDDYIIQLDKFCSNIFAFSYLVLFVALCTGTYIGLFKGSMYLVTWLSGGPTSPFTIPMNILWGSLITVLSFIYILDFALLSPFKREKGIDRVFYPFYKFLSWISLSFIYRTLYYTMMGNRISKRFLFFIIPFYILIYLGDSLYVQTQPLIPKSSNPFAVIPEYYEDLNPDSAVKLASTPSKYVSNGILEVFIPIVIDEVLSGKIDRYCKENPTVHSTLISSTFEFYNNDQTSIQTAEQVKPYIDCMNSLFRISIDTIVIGSTPFFHQHPKTTQYGLLHIIDIDSLSRGVHQINIGRIDSKKTSGQDSVYYRPYALFPVWKI